MSSTAITGKTQAVLAPGAGDAYVQKQQPKPCIVILIHGVNDLAWVYDDLEAGICAGLNERLDHLLTKQGRRSPAALNPATYTSPKVTLDADYPSLIVSQTLEDKDQGRAPQSGPRGRK